MLAIRAMTDSDEDLARFATCFEVNGDPKDTSILRWQYQRPPALPDRERPRDLYVDLATDPDRADKIAAIYATFPVEAQLGQHKALAVQSLDTLTDADYRGRGLFTEIAARVYARCQEDGAAFVYGFPNGSSAPGFFGKLGWTRLGSVPYLFLPLRSRYFLRRAGLPERALRFVPDALPSRYPPPAATPDEEVAVCTEIDPGVDALWERFSQHVRTAIVRDLRYLSWRLSRPKAGYKLFVFRRAGAVLGFCVTSCREKHGGRVGYVMELLHVPDDHRAGEILLSAAIDDLVASKADVALAWCLEHSPNRTTYRRAGFRTLPERLRPVELHFGVRALAAPPDAALGNRRNWYLSYLDSDTV